MSSSNVSNDTFPDSPQIETPVFISYDLSPQNTQLMHVLNFTEKTLYANQEGTLTPMQRQYLWHRFRECWYDLIIPIFMIFGLLVLGFIAGGRSSIPVCGSFSLFILMFGFLIVFEGQFKIYKDLKANRAEYAKGAVYLSSVKEDFYGTLSIYPYEITVAGCPYSFRVTRQVAEAFTPRDVYTLYYVPNGQILLSAEHMPEESPRRIPTPSRIMESERRERQEKAATTRKKGNSRNTRQKHAQAIKGQHRSSRKKAQTKPQSSHRPTMNRGHRGTR